MTLDQIALKHGTDKSSICHHYTRWYERYFAPFVGTDVTIVEIGICRAESLRMWREFFGPAATVVGIDNVSVYCQTALADGFKVYEGSQDDHALMARVMAECNPHIVVDDGGHQGALQVACFHNTFPLLRQGGIYVIEDLHAAYWGWGGHGLVPYLHELVDGTLNRGKSHYGDISIDPQRPGEQMSSVDRNLAAMHVHPSIVFIEKLLKG